MYPLHLLFCYYINLQNNIYLDKNFLSELTFHYWNIVFFLNQPLLHGFHVCGQVLRERERELNASVWVALFGTYILKFCVLEFNNNDLILDLLIKYGIHFVSLWIVIHRNMVEKTKPLSLLFFGFIFYSHLDIPMRMAKGFSNNPLFTTIDEYWTSSVPT